MSLISYAAGKACAKFFQSNAALTAMFALIFAAYAYMAMPAKKSEPVKSGEDLLASECAGQRLEKYESLMTEKKYWLASLQMGVCSRLNQPQYKEKEMAAELLHYQRELQESAKDKVRRMSAINSMIAKGHPVSAELVAEFRKYEEAEAARSKAAEAKYKKSRGVSIGMTADDVLASSWGKPRRVNTTTRASGVSEQWVYDGGYLYLENGVLTTIRN